MKKFITFILSFYILITLSFPAFAAGDVNVDSGGGGMGNGTSTNSWTPGRDGVRVTVIRDSDKQAMTTPIDFSDESNGDIKMYFGAVSKLSYVNGRGLSIIMDGYTSVKPASPMPQIISSSGSNNITAIRNYFRMEGTIRDISNITGFNYDTLINGDYKILIEPIAYFKYNGVMYAMTATEAALLNQMKSNDLRSKMVSLTHKNLPLSMFLEESDLGFSAWGGSTTTAQTDQIIIANLGMGVIRFKEELPEPQENDVVYRADTDVITSVTVSTGTEKTPEDPAYVRFHINGRTYTHSNIYIPEDGSQLAWVKWRTPKDAANITISVSSNCHVDAQTIVAQIVDMDKNPPPDPQANDRNDDFRNPSVPNKQNVTSLTWGEWDSWWHEYWVDNGYWDYDSWTDSEGNTHTDRDWVSNWEDEGWYKFKWIPYSANLSASMNINPDEKAPTATSTQMKSGYGVNMEVTSSVRSSAPTSHYTGMQNVIAYFPEFQYTTFWRLLERQNSGYSMNHEFKKNKYSTFNQPVHFSPVWFPDGNYVVYGTCIDAWTPAGMLQINLTDDVRIRDSLFSDWHIRPLD